MGFPLIVRATLLAVGVWLCALGMSENVWAEGTDTLLQGFSSNTPAGRDLQKWLGSSLSVKPSYFDRDPLANIKLLDDGVQRDALDFLVKSSLPGQLTGEGEVAMGSFNSQTEKLYHQHRNQLLRFRLAGDLGSIGYGAEYRSVGQGFRRQPGVNANWRPDQEGTETWASQSFGPLSLKALFSNFWDNVEADPRRLRTTRTLGGTAVGFTLPGGSVVNLSYQRGSSEAVGGPSKNHPQESWIEDLGASLYYYGGPAWDFTLLSNYSPSTNKLDPTQKVSSYYHELAGSYRPTESITFAPSINLNEQRYSWSGVRTITSTGMLSLSYFPPSGSTSLTTYGFYSKSKSNDGWYDVQTVNLVNSLSWSLNKAKSQVLTFDFAYTQYLDTVYRNGSYEELVGRLLLKAGSF